VVTSSRYLFRFAGFELDPRGYELRRRGRVVRLERQPMDLLILLVERRRELVTRDEIIAHLWGDDVFVDVETGINTAVRKIRQALNESVDRPKRAPLVETVPGKGYRFVADVAVVTESDRSPVMLAVLPFVNLSADAERDYLADGLTEDAIAALSQIDPPHVRIIGRTSAMAFKGTKKSLATIGSELNVQFVVDGSIRGDGPMLRIHCTLNRVADQAQLWSAAFDRKLAELAGVTRDLALAVAEQIHLQLSPERMDAVSQRQSRDSAAYDTYLRGRRFWNQLTAVTTRKAVEYYRRATETDPHYALAWAGIAEAFASASINGDAEPLVMWPRALEAAEKAIAANPNLSEARHVRGQVQWLYQWNWPAAIETFRRAIALDQSSAWSHSMLGHVLSQSGRHDEARPFMERACVLEPMSPLHYAMASQVAFQARDFDTARERARRAIAVDPEFWVGYMMLGQVCEHVGETEIALDALATATRLSDGNSKPVGLRGFILARLGDVAAARDVLSMLNDLAGLRYVPPFAMALIHAGLGEDERVFEFLRQAYAVRDVHLVFLTVDIKWDRYRSTNEFSDLLEHCAFGQIAAPS
jgi:TolB-like protein/Flp pilus assembly protein TadD